MKKKAAGLFSGLKKSIFGGSSSSNPQNNSDSTSPSKTPNDKGDDGFDSGEDDDLIVIGKHKGVGSTQSQLQNIESLSGDQIIKEDKYAKEFDKLQK